MRTLFSLTSQVITNVMSLTQQNKNRQWLELLGLKGVLHALNLNYTFNQWKNFSLTKLHS